MNRTTAFAVSLMLLIGAQGASAQGVYGNTPGQTRVRYIVNDVPASVAFYTSKLGFKLEGQAGSNFAAISRGDLQLLLSPQAGTGSASQPMPNGQRPAPGGWNRIVLSLPDLQSEVDRLRKEGVRFRNDITAGAGGRQILLDDPSGNTVELFQPG